MFPGVTNVGFTDAVGIIEFQKYLYEVMHTAYKAVNTIRQWLSSVGLQLAGHKTEARGELTKSITWVVGDCGIASKASLKISGNSYSH